MPASSPCSCILRLAPRPSHAGHALNTRDRASLFLFHVHRQTQRRSLRARAAVNVPRPGPVKPARPAKTRPPKTQNKGSKVPRQARKTASGRSLPPAVGPPRLKQFTDSVLLKRALKSKLRRPRRPPEPPPIAQGNSSENFKRTPQSDRAQRVHEHEPLLPSTQDEDLEIGVADGRRQGKLPPRSAPGKHADVLRRSAKPARGSETPTRQARRKRKPYKRIQMLEPANSTRPAGKRPSLAQYMSPEVLGQAAPSRALGRAKAVFVHRLMRRTAAARRARMKALHDQVAKMARIRARRKRIIEARKRSKYIHKLRIKGEREVESKLESEIEHASKSTPNDISTGEPASELEGQEMREEVLERQTTREESVELQQQRKEMVKQQENSRQKPNKVRMNRSTMILERGRARRLAIIESWKQAAGESAGESERASDEESKRERERQEMIGHVKKLKKPYKTKRERWHERRRPIYYSKLTRAQSRRLAILQGRRRTRPSRRDRHLSPLRRRLKERIQATTRLGRGRRSLFFLYRKYLRQRKDARFERLWRRMLQQERQQRREDVAMRNSKYGIRVVEQPEEDESHRERGYRERFRKLENIKGVPFHYADPRVSMQAASGNVSPPAAANTKTHTRPILLTLDAFGTIFGPRLPIAQQYRETALEFGIDVPEREILASFSAAFKHTRAKYPNYGRDAGFTTPEWWALVLRHTFPTASPLVLPHLQRALYLRFSSNLGYRTYDDFTELLHLIGTGYAARQWAPGRSVVGVVSNADERLPQIFNSLRIERRFALMPRTWAPPTLRRTGPVPTLGRLAFHQLSVRVGAEKSVHDPAHRIWAAVAAQVDTWLPRTPAWKRMTRSGAATIDSVAEFHKMHVGDDLQTDVFSPLLAGWDAVWLRRDSPVRLEEVVVDVPPEMRGRLPGEVDGRVRVTAVNKLNVLPDVVTWDRLEGSARSQVPKRARGRYDDDDVV